jgi:molecular chaperone GrpE
MSQQRRDTTRGAPEDEKVEVKVVDRRRFRQDGEPVEAAEEAGAPADAPEGAAAPGGPAAPDDRDQRLAVQAARIDELTRAYAALVEDNKAFRQRLEREKARVVEAERTTIAQSLLEAGDDLERALSAVASSDVQSPAVKTVVEGVRLSLAALQKRIAELGAERILVAGQPFDPRVAEAVDTVPVADAAQDGAVVQEIRAGYRIGERVLRPARVRVGKLARA